MVRYLWDVPSEVPEPANSEAVAILRRVVEDRLRCSCYSALQNVSCDDRGGVLRLKGRVSSQYLKQVAQEMVSAVAGKQPISNEIEVVALGAHSPTHH